MARNQVRTLWTAVVTAFLALCTALGLITTTASAAVPQSGPACKSTPDATAPASVPWIVSYARSLPPTMKQRIRAEAHGASPSCRHRAHSQVVADTTGPAAALALPPGTGPLP